uniref:protein Daple-like n=1 Tax=Solea senegalensis TaxID=28829 RepID=UPI001CD8CD2A|nr:protein Daple-like [Solea senegalensis]
MMEQTIAIQAGMIRDLHAKLEMDTGEKKSLNHAHQQQLQVLHHELEALKDTNLELADKIAIEEDVSYKLMTQTVALSEELQMQTLKTDSLAKENKSLIVRLETKEKESISMEAHRELVEHLRLESKDLKDTNQELSDKLQTETKKNESLTKENESLSRENKFWLKENKTLSTENKSLIAKLETREKQCLSLNAHQEQFEDLHLELHGLKDNNLELSGKLQTEIKKFESLTAELEEQRTCSQKLRNKLQKHKDAQQKACDAVDQSRDVTEELCHKMDALKATNQQLVTKLQTEEELSCQLQALVDELSSCLEMETKKKASLTKENQVLAAKWEEEHTRRTELQQELESTKEDKSRMAMQLQTERQAFIRALELHETKVYKVRKGRSLFFKRVWCFLGFRKTRKEKQLEPLRNKTLTSQHEHSSKRCTMPSSSDWKKTAWPRNPGSVFPPRASCPVQG